MRLFKGQGTKQKKHNNVFVYRDLKRLDKERFVEELNEAPWDTAFIFDDIDDTVSCWYEIFNSILDNLLPARQKKVKCKSQPIWFTRDIHEKIKEWDVLFKKAKRSGNLEGWTVFKQAKNRVRDLIRKAKEHHFKNQFAESKDNSKKLWGLIRNLTRQDVNKHRDIRQLKNGENIVTDKRSGAELFNLYFVNQHFNLLNNLSSNMQLIISFGKIKDQRTNKNCVFTIPYITPQNVIVRNMSSNKATGLDGVGVKIMKVAAPAIAPSLCTLINYCIDNSTFPSLWKYVQVIPVYKGHGRKDDMGNYCPISILPLLSKVFEKHIHHALFGYMKENNLLHQLQSGFQQFHSTETALIRLTDQILLHMDNDRVTGLIFIDYKKAFELIDHDIVLLKLEAYGVESKELMLLKQYLRGRKQSVTINGVQSDPQPITHGIPQGSVLGPLLFTIFINDLPQSIVQSVVDIYADDTTISASASVSSPQEMMQKLQGDINQVV